MSDDAPRRGETKVRMSVELHEQLIREAQRQGVSVNHLMVELLAGGIGFKLDEAYSSNASSTRRTRPVKRGAAR